MTSRPVSIRKLMEREAPLARWLREARSHQELLEQVRRSLPPDLAPHCTAAVRNGDRLVLFARSPVWANRLRFAAPGALSLPWVRDIRVRVLPPGAAAAGYRQAQRPSPPSRGSAELVRAAADAVSDTRLGEALRRLAARLEGTAR